MNYDEKNLSWNWPVDREAGILRLELIMFWLWMSSLRILLLQVSVLKILNPMHVWQVSPQPSSSYTCQIWMWYVKDEQCFDDIEKQKLNNGSVLMPRGSVLQPIHVSFVMHPNDQLIKHEIGWLVYSIPLCFNHYIAKQLVDETRRLLNKIMFHTVSSWGTSVMTILLLLLTWEIITKSFNNRAIKISRAVDHQ